MGGSGGLERTAFQLFPLSESVVVLETMILGNVYFEGVMILKVLIS